MNSSNVGLAVWDSSLSDAGTECASAASGPFAPGTTGTARGTASLGCHLPEGLFTPGAARG